MDFWDWVWRDRIEVLEGCIERLAIEPHSHYRASMLGDQAWIGWTTEAALLAEVVDMVAYVAQATGQNKGARHKQVIQRPSTKQAKRVISTRDDVSAALAGLIS